MKQPILFLLSISASIALSAQTWMPHWQGADYNHLVYWHQGTDQAYVGYEYGFYGLTENGSDYHVISTDGLLRFRAMDFLSLTNGWALKQNDQFELYASHTTDGGLTWQTTGQIPEFGSNPAIRAWSDNLILVSTGTKIYRSTDAGQTWNQVANLPNGAVDIFFYDAQQVWIAGNQGVVLKSTDGGVSWATINAGISTTYPADDIRFQSAQEIFIAVSGGAGVIRKSTDGGASWSDIIPGVFVITAFELEETGHLLVASQNEIRESIDGGANWSTIHSWTYNRNQGHFWTGAENRFVLTGMGGQIYTQNADQSWTEVNSGSQGFVSMDFINVNEGWAAGYSTTVNRLYHTSDGGITWHLVNAPAGVVDVDFIDDLHGYVQAVGGLYRTTDGGVNWELKSATISGLMEVTDSENVHVLQNNNTVWNTSDGGNSWQDGQFDVPLPFAAFPLYDIEFTSNTHGVLSGDTGGNPTGTVYFTNDGGLNWTKNLNFPASDDLPECSYINSSLGFHSTLGTLYKTTNGGGSWTTLNVGPTSYYLSNLYFSDANNGWAVKYIDNGYYLMQSTNGGSTWSDVSSFWMGSYILSDFYIPDMANGKMSSPDIGFIRWDDSLCPLPSFSASLDQEITTVCLGNNAFIGFTASSDVQSITWYRNNQVISTNETLTITGVELSDSGEYTCVLTRTNGCGTYEVTLVAQLNVVTEVVPVTTISSNVSSACEGGLLEFTATIDGGTTISYIWTQDGSVVSFAESLSFANAQPEMSGTYALSTNVLTACGMVSSTSNEIEISIDSEFSLILQPLNPEEYLCTGNSITIPAQVFSQIPTEFTWSFNDEVISTEEQLILSDITLDMAGTYQLTVTAGNGCGTLSEQSEVLIYVAQSAAISAPTLNQEISTCIGSSLTLICDAIPLTENTGIEYMWYRNGEYVFYGQVYEIMSVTEFDGGEYICEVIYYNECGDVTEDFEMYTILLGADGPVIQPDQSGVQLSACEGSDVLLVFDDNLTIDTYNWIFNGQSVGNAQELELSDFNAGMTGGYYCQVIASNACGTTDTTILMYTVALTEEVIDFDAPEIEETALCDGSSYELVFESTAEILSWIWMFNGNVISNEESFVIADFGSDDAGEYSCTVTMNSGCELLGETFVTHTLNYLSPPTIESPALWGDLLLCGNGFLYIPYSNPEGIDSFAWYHNGEQVATGSELFIENLDAADAGIYTCEVTATNACGSSTEVFEMVTLTVDIVVPVVVENNGVLSTTEEYISTGWYLDGNLVGIFETFTPTVSGNYTAGVTNANGCEGYSEVFVFVGIEEGEESQIVCLPNPFTNEIKISSNELIRSIEIYDISGKCVGRHPSGALQLGYLEAGIYVLKCETMSGYHTVRVEKIN